MPITRLNNRGEPFEVSAVGSEYISYLHDRIEHLDACLAAISEQLPHFEYVLTRPAGFPPEGYDVWIHDLIIEARYEHTKK